MSPNHLERSCCIRRRHDDDAHAVFRRHWHIGSTTAIATGFRLAALPCLLLVYLSLGQTEKGPSSAGQCEAAAADWPIGMAGLTAGSCLVDGMWYLARWHRLYCAADVSEAEADRSWVRVRFVSVVACIAASLVNAAWTFVFIVLCVYGRNVGASLTVFFGLNLGLVWLGVIVLTDMREAATGSGGETHAPPLYPSHGPRGAGIRALFSHSHAPVTDVLRYDTSPLSTLSSSPSASAIGRSAAAPRGPVRAVAGPLAWSAAAETRVLVRPRPPSTMIRAELPPARRERRPVSAYYRPGPESPDVRWSPRTGSRSRAISQVTSFDPTPGAADGSRTLATVLHANPASVATFHSLSQPTDALC